MNSDFATYLNPKANRTTPQPETHHCNFTTITVSHAPAPPFLPQLLLFSLQFLLPFSSLPLLFPLLHQHPNLPPPLPLRQRQLLPKRTCQLLPHRPGRLPTRRFLLNCDGRTGNGELATCFQAGGRIALP